MLKPILFWSTITLFTPFAAQAAPSSACVKAEKDDIGALFDRWNASLQTGDARNVAQNYTSDAVLLPTVSNEPRLDQAGRIDYFEHFLAKKPVGKINTSTVRIGCNKAVDTGTYTFTFSDNSSVDARYTFTYVWVNDQWLITSHHSSAMPEA